MQVFLQATCPKRKLFLESGKSTEDGQQGGRKERAFALQYSESCVQDYHYVILTKDRG